MSELQPGTVLQNTYRVVRPIGRGAMGEVYEVEHARLSGRYALKLLNNEAAADAEFLQRFRREAQIVSGLRHPHIVQVIDFDQSADGRPYLVMELLDGEDLAIRVTRDGALPLSRVVTIISQIASALQTAHGLGVIHRDLKPENVLLMRTSEQGDFAKLVDFGISKVKNASLRLTQERMMIGTPHYMSPEQARSLEVDERADQFALAAIAYELLSSELAFAGENVPAVVYQVVHGEPPRLADPAGWISPDVDTVLRRALAKHPEDRYATVTEFARAFEAAARGVDDSRALRNPRPATATTRRTNARGAGPARPRHRRTIAAAAVLGVGVMTAAWLAIRSAQSPALLSAPAPSTAAAPRGTPALPQAAPPDPAPPPAALPERVAPPPLPVPATAEPAAERPARRTPPARPKPRKKDPLYNDL